MGPSLPDGFPIKSGMTEGETRIASFDNYEIPREVLRVAQDKLGMTTLGGVGYFVSMPDYETVFSLEVNCWRNFASLGVMR